MTGDQITDRERQIGRKATGMVQAYLDNLLEQKLTLRGKGTKGKNPLLKATRITTSMGDYRLQGLNFTSNKVGFVQHYGFSGVRQGGSLELKAARYKKTRATRNAHSVHLPKLDLFSDIYIKSGAADYILKELKETRTAAAIEKLTSMVLKLNKESNNGSK